MDEIEINNILSLILQVDELENKEINSIQTLISNPDLQKICIDYEEHKKELHDIGFNIFTIVSDLYYREKFHSQIIAALLDPKEKHEEGNKFLDKFLSFLNDKFREKCKINIADYQNAQVTGTKNVGEKRYIDIWIKGSGKCIIIENKINNAPDTKLQIPTYVKDVKEEGYDIDAIIYLSLDGRKQNSDKRNWKDRLEKEEIEKKLLEIAAYNNEDGEKRDLYHGWINPCIKIAKEPDAWLILRQYANLIKTLNITTMNDQIMGKFVDIILDENKFNTANSITQMVNELPLYMAKRLAGEFEPNLILSPFNQVKAEEKSCWFRGFLWQMSEIALTIDMDLEKFRIQFFDDTYYYSDGESDAASDILECVDYKKMFTEMSETNGGKKYYEKTFQFPKQYKEMKEFVDSFNKKLLEFSENK